MTIFWSEIVTGFSGAGYLIHSSFDNWSQSPISTTIDTLPISQITFPNVTVCPPKTVLLNLNYDISKLDEVKLDKDKRAKLIEDSLHFQDEFLKEMMTNLSKLEDPDRYYNWYHGYSRIIYPFYDANKRQLIYNMDSSATSGNVSTKYFGDKFDADKVDGYINIKIKVYVPHSVVGDKNTTLIFDINKITMKEEGEEKKKRIIILKDVKMKDKIAYNCRNTGYIDPDLTPHWRKDIIAPDKFTLWFFFTVPGPVQVNVKL